METGYVGILTLLDVSAVFDTVDHAILKENLPQKFAFGGHTLD